MKKKLFIFLITLCLCGCNNLSKEEKISEVMKSDNYIIIDVRTKEEYDEGHIVGSINIPYEEISKERFDKEIPILVYCRSGNRSSIAYNILNNLGYEVYDLGAFESIDMPKE